MEQTLIENRFLDPGIDEGSWDGFECLSPDRLAGIIRQQLCPENPRLVLAFGHDNYTAVVGGIQLCTGIEQKAFKTRDIAYLQAHPAIPAATLLPAEAAQLYAMGLVFNGESIGFCRAADILLAISILKKEAFGLSLYIVVHALLGHSAEFVAELCTSVPAARAFFWVHDYYSICPMHNLLRNNILFCNAPEENSPACSACIHGEERKRHRAIIHRLFERCKFDIVAPSRAALELWRAKAGLPHRSSTVIEHAAIIPTGSRTAETTKRLKVAFLGLPRYHKGWQTYSKLVMCLRDDPRYEFFLFGKEEKLYPPVCWREVVVERENPDAMREALCREEIDVAVLWSICPETFCITAHEALASGAFLIANENSGNVAELVRAASCGMVLKDDDMLLEAFKNGEVAERALESLKKGIGTGRLQYSALTADTLHFAEGEVANG
jgi:hypothetical protein